MPITFWPTSLFPDCDISSKVIRNNNFMWDVVVQVYLKRAPVALFQTDAAGLKKETCLDVLTLYYVLNDLK